MWSTVHPYMCCLFFLFHQTGHTDYMVRRYATITVASERVRRVFHRDVTPMDVFQPDFGKFAKSLIGQGKVHRAVLVDQVCWLDRVAQLLLLLSSFTRHAVTTVKCHYNACHYNANASLTRSSLGSQTAPSWPSPSGSAHGQKVWNHRGLIGHSGNDTPLFPYKWNKTKVSHLLVMSIQSIHDWSSIKHTDYSSPMLWECHNSANMAARRPDVENNPGCNQVKISHTHVN